jgi:hypothetical protein
LSHEECGISDFENDKNSLKDEELRIIRKVRKAPDSQAI